MIKNLKDLSKRFFISNKWITFSSIIAISLSILLITSLLNFSINSENNLKKENFEKFGAFEMQCGYEMDSSKRITKEFLNEASSLEGIEKISSVIVDSTNININGIDTYTVGIDNDELSKSKYKYNSDIEENTIIINKQLADTLNIKQGDNVLVNGNENKIIEIFEDKTYSSNSINMVIMNRKSLKEILRFSEEANYIMVKVQNDDYTSKVSKELIDLDNDLRVEVFQENKNLIENINTMRYFIGFLGILVFIMCGIFIASNFQGYIYKYTKDFAIIKAVGGSNSQVFKTVLMQTMMMNIIGVSSGIILSFLTCKLFLNSFEYYILQAAKIALIGFITIQVVLLIPAFKTARILPIKAMSKNENLDFKHLKLIKFVMILSISIGTLLILDSIILNESDSFINGIVGFLFIYLSSFLFVIRYVNKILNLFIKTMETIIGAIGAVSIKMLIHQVKKSSILILAITTMIIITTIGGSLVKVLTINNETYYRNDYLADIVLTSDDELDYKETLNILNDINKIDGTVASAMTEGGTTHIVSNYTDENITFILGNLKEMEKQNLIKKFNGNATSKVIVNEEYAKNHNISIGDKIEIISPKYELKTDDNSKEGEYKKNYKYTLEVSSIENDKITNTANVLIDIGNSDIAQGISGTLSKIYIDTNNKNIDVLLNNIKEEYPSIKWSNLENVLNETNKAIEQRWQYFKLALLIIDCIILFGIIISIKSDINSNRKEYALLRCMKLKQNDLSKMIITQSIVFLLFGQILGLILGTIGSCIVTLSDGANAIIVPDYKTLLLICICSIIITVFCIIPDICKIQKEKLIVELNKEEL
ncbi:MAG: FtsX-like permease family protein [Clostridium butyricum]|uniref:ABC transporter permease n=1 Tax=Clostridium sp. TaxID=1506 RepID=UPI0029004F6F|nr:FtsX-like permease family protein [Clostridium sp.]MDU1117055.1 FtsX-like permease family protein [Clostridium sp.]MDU7713379.1 FtsX-like permease family protein [Clostridium butyricum]